MSECFFSRNDANAGAWTGIGRPTNVAENSQLFLNKNVHAFAEPVAALLQRRGYDLLLAFVEQLFDLTLATTLLRRRHAGFA